MIFQCDGVTYDSQHLGLCSTHDERLPMILWTRDHSKVFVVTCSDDDGVMVRPASPEELPSLLCRYGITMLAPERS